MTTRPSALIVVGSVMLGLCLPAAAHHGAAGLFDLGRTVAVNGSVKKWSFVNPHPILVLEVTDENGEKADWDIYFGPSAASILRNRGYAPDTFKFGEALTVTGHPAKITGLSGFPNAILGSFGVFRG